MGKLEISDKDSETNSKDKLKTVLRVLREGPPKSRNKLILKLLFAFISISGLIIQTTILVLQYLERGTVVKVDVGFIMYNRVPAITICYNNYLSMEKVAQKYPQLNETYQDYLTFISNVSKSDMNETMLEQMNDLLNKNFTMFIENQNLTVNELFDLSIPSEDIEGSVEPIKISVHGSTINKELGDTSDDWVYGNRPVESIVFPFDDLRKKCFTYFSDLHEESRELKMFIETIFIQVNVALKWFPPTTNAAKKISFSIHSPNAIPNELTVADFYELDSGQEYQMTFNEKKSLLLEAPYKTNCRVYEHGYHTSIKLRDDCMNDCIVKTLRKYSYNPKHCLFRTKLIWRKYSMNSLGENMTVCSLSKRHALENLKCEFECQSDCVNRFYYYEIKVKENIGTEDRDVWQPYTTTSIEIKHNQLPDEIVTHIPEVTFTSLSASFGGLLGLWMGLSTMAILNLFTHLI